MRENPLRSTPREPVMGSITLTSEHLVQGLHPTYPHHFFFEIERQVWWKTQGWGPGRARNCIYNAITHNIMNIMIPECQMYVSFFLFNPRPTAPNGLDSISEASSNGATSALQPKSEATKRGEGIVVLVLALIRKGMMGMNIDKGANIRLGRWQSLCWSLLAREALDNRPTTWPQCWNSDNKTHYGVATILSIPTPQGTGATEQSSFSISTLRQFAK